MAITISWIFAHDWSAGKFRWKKSNKRHFRRNWCNGYGSDYRWRSWKPLEWRHLVTSSRLMTYRATKTSFLRTVTYNFAYTLYYIVISNGIRQWRVMMTQAFIQPFIQLLVHIGASPVVLSSVDYALPLPSSGTSVTPLSVSTFKYALAIWYFYLGILATWYQITICMFISFIPSATLLKGPISAGAIFPR